MTKEPHLLGNVELRPPSVPVDLQVVPAIDRVSPIGIADSFAVEPTGHRPRQIEGAVQPAGERAPVRTVWNPEPETPDRSRSLPSWSVHSSIA